MGLSKRPGLVMMDGSSDAGSFAVATTMIKLSTGNEYISQTCMTVSEFDGEIDRLIMKLKSIQSGGHAKVVGFPALAHNDLAARFLYWYASLQRSAHKRANRK